MQNNPLINILIRVSRPQLFERCIKSVLSQTYENVSVYCAADNDESLTIVNKILYSSEKLTVWDNTQRINILKVYHLPGTKKEYCWNLYCNKLKSKVNDGYFFFLDDDDYIHSNVAIEQVVKHLQDEPDGLIVQFLRNGKPKPSNHLINRRVVYKGLIGGGCLVLHSKHKDVANWDNEAAADYRWIKDVSERVNLKFVPLVLQVAGNNGLHGKKQ